MSEILHAVMVYRHRETKEIRCLFWDAPPMNREDHEVMEHIATLNPRLWIQNNWDKVENGK